jgi:hypothetical protein
MESSRPSNRQCCHSGSTFHLVQLLHQARLASGGIVLVNDTLGGRLVQGDRSRMHGLLSLLKLARFHQMPCPFYGGASSPTEYPVAQSPALRAAETLDR